MVAAWGSQHVVRKQEQNEIWSKPLFNSYLLFFRNVSFGLLSFSNLANFMQLHQPHTAGCYCFNGR